MPPSLCNVCSTINIECLTSEWGFRLHENILKIHKSAATCRLCSHAAERLRRNSISLKHSLSNEAFLAIQQARVFYGKHVHHKHGLTIVVSDIDSKTPSEGVVLPWLLMRTLNGDPSEKHGAKSARLLPDVNSSAGSTKQALMWLRECLLSKDCFEKCSHTVNSSLEKHLLDVTDLDDDLTDLTLRKDDGPFHQGQSQSPRLKKDIELLYQKRPSLPNGAHVEEECAARLVEIISIGSDIQLKLVKASIDYAPYVALSYRWGNLDAVWQTETKNLDLRHTELPASELPKTILDAIKVTKDLGFKWVWIDSLCIIQDDKDDWAREAIKMASIYQNAIVTIAAGSSHDAKYGLHNTKSTSILNTEDSIKICSILSTGEESRVILFADQTTRLESAVTTRDMGDLVSHCPLRDRGWTMQERILSPRIIHYASDQLYWECYHGIQESEDELLKIGCTSNISKMAHRVKFAIDDDVKSRELKKLHYYWYVHLVGADYSHRALTYSEDKLLAIAGIAKALDNIEPLGYMAGHWAHDDDELVKSLCWSRDGPGRKSLVYRAPSWSWASQDSAVNYGHYSFVGTSDNVIAAQPLAMEGGSQDGSAFGRYKNGYLQIKAKVARGSVFPNCGHDFRDCEQLTSLYGACSNIPPPKERCSFLMLEGGETSDIVWLDESHATQEPVCEPINVQVVMLSEIRCGGAEPSPGACLICTLDENYYLTRIGFTESVKPFRGGDSEKGPPVTGPRVCDKEAIALIIL
ncbi:hypothetical protein FHETE_3944 [Fusarium heterosporum]|uniref:Heterokaryon incompatibility domain-containing protein n=1 Tax=Fusarium heterosporum TaxID=42747 RepID=A0A8H5TMD1_FUSHE|nr:hypothetical protein FHETE_3944 [Fusarium heterosporum]